MPGSKIPVLEIENLLFKIGGRGIIVYNDGTNFHKGHDWTGTLPSSASTRPRFFPAASSSGWVKIHVASGSLYGPTGASYYIPIYSNLNTNLST